MGYKVYIEGEKGYIFNGKYSIDDLIFLLDELILKNENPIRILVIQHDILNNCDSPFYLFSGNQLEYLAFKKIISKEPEYMGLRLK